MKELQDSLLVGVQLAFDGDGACRGRAVGGRRGGMRGGQCDGQCDGLFNKPIWLL
jgi:hypothetical protein